MAVFSVKSVRKHASSFAVLIPRQLVTEGYIRCFWALKYETTMFREFIKCLFDNSFISYMVYVNALFLRSAVFFSKALVESSCDEWGGAESRGNGARPVE